MDTRATHHEKISPWLREERHISIEVADAAGLDTFNDELRIPIRNIEGASIFSKYRRSPFQEGGSKYRYEKGATAALFGAETLKNLKKNEVLLITEGELDALALRTLGYNAVSSTGGAGTWKKEWNNILAPYDCVLLYDADRAGVHGMLRVLESGLRAGIAWLPVEYGNDPTEVIHSGNAEAIRQAINGALIYTIPSKDDSISDRKLEYQNLYNRLQEERMQLNSEPLTTPFHRDLALDWVSEKMADVREEQYKLSRGPLSRKADGDSGLEKAKQFPIDEIIKVSRSGFAKCVWHEEKSASMKVYRGPDQHAYSYCCHRRADTIDIYCAVNEMDPKNPDHFKAAIKALQV